MDLIYISGIVFILCLIGLSWFAGSDAPYVPTKMVGIDDILKKAGLKKGKVFYELGSGDGRVVIAAAKLGAISHGVEQSWLRVWYSRYITKKLKLKNTYFYHGNIFDRQYFPADIVYIYMLPKAVGLLEKKLQKELKKGSSVITQRYHFKNWPVSKSFEEFNIYQKS